MDDRAVETVQTALAETRWLPVPCPTEYLPALARDILWALEKAGMPVAQLQSEWAVLYDGESIPEGDVTDDRAHAEALAAERCRSCDTCRGALPKHVVTRLVGPWSVPQEQPREAAGNPICSQCSMPEPAEWCWRQSVKCPFGKPPRNQEGK